MQRKIYATLLGAGLAFSPIAGLKAASLIYLGLGTSNQVNISLDRYDLQEDDSTRANANAQINANVNSNVDIDSTDNEDARNGNAATSSDNRQNSGLPNATSTAATANAQTHASEQSNINFSASQVSTEDDLRAFALSSMRSDEDLNSISFESDTVTVVYNDEGRFIGFIPVTLTVKVSVDQNGDVTIDYPWYGFLVAKDKADIDARVRAAIDGAASVRASGAGWTNSDRAELAESIHAALKAHYEADEDGNATSTDEE